MKRVIQLIVVVVVMGLLYAGCKKETLAPTIPEVPPPTVTTPGPTPTPAGDQVSVDLGRVPYQKLSDYGFFIGEMKNQVPSAYMVPYKPASSLFTDYALKKRFVWLPGKTRATYVSDNKVLELPVGSALIKTFYYDHVQPSDQTKILETRVMIRKPSGWIFAEYVWNAEQTEAFLDMSGSTTSISWLQEGTPKSTIYRIPSEIECLTCHKFNNQPIPIGIKPQNLNTLYHYGTQYMNQLQYWISRGILQNSIPSTIESTIDFRDTSYSLKTRLRSYLDINCAHCHSENSHCDYRPLRLAFSETILSINMGVCVTPAEDLDPSLLKIIVPGNITKSVMHFRLNSTNESTRMPLLGRTLVDEEGVALLRAYILSITDCN